MTWEEEQPLWASELSKKRERCAARTWGPNVTDSGVASLLPERAVPQARKTSRGAAEGAGPGLLVPGTLSRRGPPPCLLPGGGNRGYPPQCVFPQKARQCSVSPDGEGWGRGVLGACEAMQGLPEDPREGRTGVPDGPACTLAVRPGPVGSMRLASPSLWYSRKLPSSSPRFIPHFL